MFAVKSILSLGIFGASAIGMTAGTQSASADLYYPPQQQIVYIPAPAPAYYAPPQVAYVPQAPVIRYVPAPVACTPPVVIAPRPIFYPQLPQFNGWDRDGRNDHRDFDRHDWDRRDNDHRDHDGRFDGRNHR